MDQKLIDRVKGDAATIAKDAGARRSRPTR
jgi:hypothetical protein